MNKLLYIFLTLILTFTFSKLTFADEHVYGPYPITLKGYSGDKKKFSKIYRSNGKAYFT